VSLRSEFRVVMSVTISTKIVVSNTYCVVFLFCLSSSCVPYVASFSVLSFPGRPFGILYRLFSHGRRVD
jgi:hypothetical protein